MNKQGFRNKIKTSDAQANTLQPKIGKIWTSIVCCLKCVDASAPAAPVVTGSFATVDEQPTELLEFVFLQFSSIQDIIKCSKTCLRWYQIIEKLFKDNSNMSSNHQYQKRT